MKILLIGNGAREHCIAEALTRSEDVELMTYAKTKNPGIFALSKEYQIGSYTDFSAILDFAKKIKPDFAFIGPDDPIADGVADLLLEAGIHSVAPLKTVARLESSKSFTRDLVQKYEIPGNPKFKIFYDARPSLSEATKLMRPKGATFTGVREFLEELGGNFVVKADGLTGGKGVLISGEHLAGAEEGEEYAKKCIEKFGRVVIEEKLVGQEFSLMSFVDGVHVVDMVPVQDHKRAFVGDKGPNTGGMGSYSDNNHLLPFLTQKDLDSAHAITEKVLAALFKETGAQFKGIMYGGFMAVKDGVRLIEYNARFGDPEVMNVLPILKTDFVEICRAILSGNLDKIKIEFEAKATVCKYIVPEGYPDKPVSGSKITIENQKSAPADKGDLKMYYASVDQKEDGLYLSSSRAIAFTGIADKLEDAEKIAQSACENVKGPVFYRPDIGTKALIEKRVSIMKSLRS